MSKPSVAIVGLGAMGAPIARNLLRAGFSLNVFDLRSEALVEFVEAGATSASSPGDAASAAEFIVTSLPADQHILTAVLGENGIASAARPDSILIEMSTAHPATVRELEVKLSSRSVHVVDAPVGRGTQAADDGKLLVLASGKPEIIERCTPIFDVIGERTFNCGEVGAGKTVKLVNNHVFGEIVAAVSEAVTLAVKAGVKPDLVLEVIGNSLAANAVASHVFPERVLTRDFSPKFKLSLEAKDLKLAEQLAESYGAPFLLGGLTSSLFGTAVGRGLGDSDVSRFVELYEQLCDVVIPSGAHNA